MARRKSTKGGSAVDERPYLAPGFTAAGVAAALERTEDATRRAAQAMWEALA